MSRKDRTLLEEKIINCVRDYPYIYLKCHPDFKDILKKENAFTAISDIVIKASGAECQKIWESLKNQYLAFLRKKKKPTGSGSGRPLYFRHESTMAFIKDNAIVERGNNNGQENEYELESSFYDDMEKESQHYEPLSQSPVDPGASQKKTNTNSDSFQFRSHTKKRKLDTFEVKLLKAIEGDEKPDEFDSFATSVAAKIRRIYGKNPILSAQVQIKIQEVLLNAEIDSLQDNIIIS